MKIYRAVGIDSIFVCRLFQRIPHSLCRAASVLYMHWFQHHYRYLHSFQYQGGVHCAVANIAEEFIALLSISRNTNNILGFKLLIGQLTTASKYVHIAVANSCM
jgi:hypothetical protein